MSHKKFLRNLTSIETSLSSTYSVHLGSTVNIALPLFSAAGNCAVDFLSQTSSVLSFIILDSATGLFTVSPPLVSFNLVGTPFLVSFDACNNDGSGGCIVISSHSFTVNVVNNPPVYVSMPLNYSTKTRINSVYTVPNYTDTEGHIATTVGSSTVSFIQWNSTINGFRIYFSH